MHAPQQAIGTIDVAFRTSIGPRLLPIGGASANQTMHVLERPSSAGKFLREPIE
jgi:hypothetical protein